MKPERMGLSEEFGPTGDRKSLKDDKQGEAGTPAPTWVVTEPASAWGWV